MTNEQLNLELHCDLLKLKMQAEERIKKAVNDGVKLWKPSKNRKDLLAETQRDISMHQALINARLANQEAFIKNYCNSNNIRI